MTYTRDTIAARATAPGRGGIGVVRISGPGVADIAAAIIGRLPEPRYATYSRFLDEDGGTIDSGIVLYFREPDSFTGEDTLELQGHGGPVVLDMLLDRIVKLGARVAMPGEFSQRAFLNDKMDLAQAEAIADLIDSGSRQAAKGAMRSLQGAFSKDVNDLVEAVIRLRVFVEAAIDFPEEEIDFVSDERVESDLQSIIRSLSVLQRRAGQGVLLTEGANVVLLGKPNAGKSSLMNNLTGRDTSIVTDIAGTTRDRIDAAVEVDGIPLNLVDTAGIRESGDTIEAEGVRRTLEARAQADLVLALVDVSEGPEQAERDVFDLAGDETVMLVANKIDLVADQSWFLPDWIPVSAKTGEGMEILKRRIRLALGQEQNAESDYTARRRHLDALNRAGAALQNGRAVLVSNRAGELLAEELRLAQQCLSEITGEFTPDDLLGEIFSSFCIGK